LGWLNSEYLRKKWRDIHGAKRKQENIPHFRIRYRGVKWLVTIIMIGATLTFAHLAAMSKLAYEQEDVFNNLSTEIHIPPGTEDEPTETLFTVRNGGHFAISGKHQLSCKVNTEILNNRPIVRDYAIYGYKVTAAQTFLLSRDIALPQGDSTITLRPNGDALSQDCLSWVDTKQMNCIDATLVFAYYLSSQPSVLKIKQWRWVAKQVLNGKAYWVQQPLDGAAEGGCFILYR
jgi:hypothetical protein